MKAGPGIFEKAWDFSFFDGQELYGLWPTNPSLSENPKAYYMTWEDDTDCPLKIFAYYIYIDEYNTVKVRLVVENTTDMEIVGFKGSFKMYDKMGDPVIGGAGENVFNFANQEINIPAKSTAITIGPWELLLFERTRKLIPSINKIQFGNGTFWQSLPK